MTCVGTAFGRIGSYALTVVRTPSEAASLMAGGCGCDEEPRGAFAIADPDAPPTAVTWSGVIGTEGELTGDGRLIALNALKWDILPIPLRYAPVDTGGHDGAQVVGRILTLERRDNGDIWGTGDIDMEADLGPQAARVIGNETCNGVSMDLDNVAFEVRVKSEVYDVIMEQMEMGAGPEDVEVDEDGRILAMSGSPDDEVMVTTDARTRAATIVAIPAFANARINLDSSTEDFNWVEDAGGLPKYIKRIAKHLQEQGMDESKAIATAVNAAKQMCETGDLNFPGKQNVNPGSKAEACAAVAEWEEKKAANAGGTETLAVVEEPEEEDHPGWTEQADGIWEHESGVRVGPLDEVDEGWGVWDAEGSLQGEYPTMEAAMDAAVEEDEDVASEEDVVVAGAAPMEPPAAWFQDPVLTGPTPLTITPDGRVYGHLAVWGTCHTAYSGQCVEPPHSPSNYAYFRTGAVLTAEGKEVPVGTITLDTLHAGRNLGPTDTLAHYEHTGRGAVDVAAGEDSFGIWVAGSLRPGLTEEKIRVLRASPISGDWRRIGGSLELVAALAVNSPGFTVARPLGLVAGGAMQSLVASGVLEPTPEKKTPPLRFDEDALLERLAIRMERRAERKVLASQMAARTRNQRARVLAARVGVR